MRWVKPRFQSQTDNGPVLGFFTVGLSAISWPRTNFTISEGVEIFPRRLLCGATFLGT